MKNAYIFLIMFFLPISIFADEEADAHFKKGIVLVEKNQTTRAIEEFKQAISLNPNHAEAHCMLGIEIYKKAVPKKNEKLLREAIKELNAAIAIDSGLAIAHDIVAFAYYILGEFETSREHHLIAKKLGLNNPVLEKKLKTAFEMLELRKELEVEQQ